jgi:hypothetical protein
MAAAVTSPIKPQQQQPSFCLFPPVANLVCQPLLQSKLKSQLKMQSHLVPPAPITFAPPDPIPSEQAVDVDVDVNGITHWSSGHIADVLFIEMCEAEIDDPQGSYGDKVSKYYLEAAKYAGRISASYFDGANAKYKPVFELRYNDFTPRLQAELQLLLKESPSTLVSVVEDSVFRIFKARHKLIFYDYIEHEDLNWRFVAAD